MQVSPSRSLFHAESFPRSEALAHPMLNELNYFSGRVAELEMRCVAREKYFVEVQFMSRDEKCMRRPLSAINIINLLINYAE